MLLQYGCINLNLLNVLEYKREATYDHANYVYTKYRLVVRAVYNPSTQQDSWAASPSFNAANNPGVPYVPADANPFAQQANNINGPIEQPLGAPKFTRPTGQPPVRAGIPAAVSDVALRHALMQPRQQLIFSVGGLVNIFSPLDGMQTDVMNGPTPIACNVVQLQGSRTWIVDYAIETCINECSLYGGNVPAVLSHVWEMQHELDADYFAKQTIRGRVLFRSDAIIRMGLNPDDYRTLIALDVPPGFKRERIQVHVGNPPNLIEYELVDRQLPLGWSMPGVTRLEATHSVSTDRESGDVVALRTIKALAGHASKLAKEVAANSARASAGMPGNELDPVHAAEIAAAVAGNATQGIIDAGADVLEGMISNMPINTHTIVVELWGDSSTNRAALEGFARQILAQRLLNFRLFVGAQLAPLMAAAGLGPAWQAVVAGFQAGIAAGAIPKAFDPAGLAVITANLLGGFKTTITHDLANKHIRLEYHGISGPLLSVFDPATPLAIANSVVFPGDDNTGDLLVPGISVSGPPGDNKSYGSYLGDCVAAALQGSCTPPQMGIEINQAATAAPKDFYLDS